MKLTKLLPFFLIILIFGCQKENITTEDARFKFDQIKPTNEYDATYAQEWMTQAYKSVRSRGFFALDASRLYSYTALTMYESMAYGNPNGLSMEGQLKNFTNVPKPLVNEKYDWAMVLCHATPRVLIHMLKGANNTIVQEITSLERTQERRLKNESNLTDEVVDNSKEFAVALSDFIIAYSESDGAKEALARPYRMPSIAENPANYDGIEQAEPFFMAPFWWTSRSFVISTSEICRPLPPYTYSEDPASRYYQDVLEVLDATRNPEKVRIGQFWANNPNQSGTPAGAWVGIANQLVDQLELDLETTLRMYLQLTLSTRDTFLAVWWTKYNWNLQRPVSYIRRVLKQPNWNSPVPTPPYPDYVSGTSANAGSSSAILTKMFGNKPFTDGQHSDKGFGVRSFADFTSAGKEAFHSRIYAGVHMRKACEEGFTQGACVANDLMSRLQFTSK